MGRELIQMKDAIKCIVIFLIKILRRDKKDYHRQKFKKKAEGSPAKKWRVIKRNNGSFPNSISPAEILISVRLTILLILQKKLLRIIVSLLWEMNMSDIYLQKSDVLFYLKPVNQTELT